MISTSEKRRWGGREGRRSKSGNIKTYSGVSENLEDHGGEDTKNQANTTSGFCTVCAVFRCRTVRGVSRVQVAGVGARCLGGGVRRSKSGRIRSGGRSGVRLRNCELLRLGIDGGEVVRVLNEVDLEAVAGGESGAGRVDRGVAGGAVNECSEDLAVAGT